MPNTLEAADYRPDRFIFSLRSANSRIKSAVPSIPSTEEIDAEMVGCGFAPLAAAEIVVIGSPAGIRTLHLRFGLFGRYVLLLAKATHPIFRSPVTKTFTARG